MLNILKKYKSKKIEKENASKIFNEILTSKEKADKNDLKTFFDKIKDPKIIEYILKNAIYTSNWDNAKLIHDYLKREYPFHLANHKKYLKKEAVSQIKKLKFSNLSKFWVNIAKDVKSTKTAEFNMSRYNLNGTTNDIISSSTGDTIESCTDNLMFSLDESTEVLICSFKTIKAGAVDANLTEILSKAKKETKAAVNHNLQKIDSKFLPSEIVNTTGEDLIKSIASSIYSKNITFKQTILKLSNFLNAIGKLRLKDLLKK